jgi:hypothetical protein
MSSIAPDSAPVAPTASDDVRTVIDLDDVTAPTVVDLAGAEVSSEHRSSRVSV